MFTRYQPRPLAFLGVETFAGYRLKVYAISYSAQQAFERERFVGLSELVESVLPQPSVALARPGVGFMILHQAQADDYLILGWWDRENELPTRVFLHGADGWRPAAGGESFCVWDLRVVGWEREAYVGTVLAGKAHGVEHYLATVTEGYV